MFTARVISHASRLTALTRCAAAPVARLAPAASRCMSAKAPGSSAASGAATTGPVQYAGQALPEEYMQKISEKDFELRKAYDELPASYPAHAQPDVGGASEAQKKIDATEAYRKRLIYRSKQRGWLEVDLLLGAWGTAHLPKLSYDDLRVYENILNLETVDLFNIMCGRTPVPAHLEGNHIMKSIQDFVASSPLGKASITAYEDVKKVMSN